jgi:hypothetical protein
MRYIPLAHATAVPMAGLPCLRGQLADLITRPAQSGFQFHLLLLPARVLRLRPSFNRSEVVCDCFDLGFVFPLGFFKGSFGLCDCLLPQPPPVHSRGLFFPSRGFTPLLLSLERKASLFAGFVVKLGSRWFFSCSPLLDHARGEARQLGIFSFDEMKTILSKMV